MRSSIQDQPTTTLGTVDSAAAREFGRKFATDKRIVFVVNSDRFFLTHRASWATSLQSSGAEITVIAEDTGHAGRIVGLGFDYIPLRFGRESVTVRESAAASLNLLSILMRIRPSTVFLVATAAYSLGWPAALMLPRCQFVRVITGAGRALSSDTKSSTVVRMSLACSRRFRNVYSLFQLPTDLLAFVNERLAVQERSRVIPGTGLDTNTWTRSERSSIAKPTVLFAARLFREKGIYEFIELARNTPKQAAKFVVVGSPDTGVSSSVQAGELEEWQAEGLIEYWGQVDEMLSVYNSADILVLPSTHPEGTPRVLIEAAACGVVAIASDQPGCREVITHGETGLIARVDDPGSFARSLKALLDDPGYRESMSRQASIQAAEKFSMSNTLEQVYEFIGVVK